jgi:hypothetical protein
MSVACQLQQHWTVNPAAPWKGNARHAHLLHGSDALAHYAYYTCQTLRRRRRRRGALRVSWHDHAGQLLAGDLGRRSSQCVTPGPRRDLDVLACTNLGSRPPAISQYGRTCTCDSHNQPAAAAHADPIVSCPASSRRGPCRQRSGRRGQHAAALRRTRGPSACAASPPHQRGPGAGQRS